MTSTEVRILVPTGMLGGGFTPESVARGLELGADVIAVDGGSTDSGPHYAPASPPSGWSGPTAVTPDGCSSGPKTFSPLPCGSSNASPAPPVSTSGPAFGWSRDVSRGSPSTATTAAKGRQTF